MYFVRLVGDVNNQLLDCIAEREDIASGGYIVTFIFKSETSNKALKVSLCSIESFCMGPPIAMVSLFFLFPWWRKGGVLLLSFSMF